MRNSCLFLRKRRFGAFSSETMGSLSSPENFYFRFLQTMSWLKAFSQ